MANPYLSIIIPVYNEADNLEMLVSRSVDALRALDYTWELILVDDASEDASASLLEDLVLRTQGLRVLRHRVRCGQSAAIWSGFQAAAGDVFITLDGDLQNDPADIHLVLDQIGDYDLVCGWRTTRKDTWVRRLSSRIANKVRHALVGDNIHDTGCGLKAFRRACGRDFIPFNGMHRFFPAVALMKGYSVTEVPVSHHPRHAGKAKYGIGNRALRGLVDCFGIRWLRARHVRPQIEQSLPPPCDSAPQ